MKGTLQVPKVGLIKMSDASERLQIVDELLAAHDLLDRGITDLEPDGLSTGMLVAAVVCANSESNPQAREALLIYVFDEAVRRRHAMHLVRWLDGLNLQLPEDVCIRLRRFLAEACGEGAAATRIYPRSASAGAH